MVWNNEDKLMIVNKYKSQFQRYGIDPRSLFWTKNRQNIRFNVIKESGISKNNSIFDIGCGFGDLYYFLKRTIDYKGNYTGIDIVNEFIQICNERYPRERHPNIDFRVLDILKDSINKKWDFVVLSGTLNHIINSNHWEYVKKMIKKMFNLCNKGISVDFVSSYGDDRHSKLFRADPNKVFTFAKTLSKRVCLRHDYMPYEFAVYLYKDKITKDKVFSEYKYPRIFK